MQSVFQITKYSNDKKRPIANWLTGTSLLRITLILITVHTIKAKQSYLITQKWRQQANQDDEILLLKLLHQSNRNNLAINLKDSQIRLDLDERSDDKIKYQTKLDDLKHFAALKEEDDMSINNTSNVLNVSNQDERLYEIPTSITILLIILYTSVILIAIFGNLMVFYIVLVSKRMRNVTNLFIANLALADILIGSLSIPFQFIAALLQRWLLPTFLCPICPTVQTISLNVSIFTLTAIAVDRHRAITKPLANKLSKLKANIIIILIWCFSLVLAVPTFLSWNIRYIQITKEIDIQIDYKLDAVRLNDQLNDKNSNQSLDFKFINGNSLASSFASPLKEFNLMRTKKQSINLTQPFCDVNNMLISEELRKLYHHFLVLIQFFVPLFIISFAYIHMAIKLNSEDLSTNARNDCQRALQVKKRVG